MEAEGDHNKSTGKRKAEEGNGHSNGHNEVEHNAKIVAREHVRS
jgi:hypothetical protein